jgi:predicted translin family RNA/ssDNA-binding protein
MFEAFRAEIDENHATRERTIKSSRDVTALSKKAYA